MTRSSRVFGVLKAEMTGTRRYWYSVTTFEHLVQHLPVVIFADGAVCGGLLPKRHERNSTRAAVGSVDDAAAHDGTASAKL